MKRMNKKDSRLKSFVKKEKREPRNFVMDILIVIAILFVFVQIGGFVEESRYVFDDYMTSVSTLSYQYMDKNYSSIVRNYMAYPTMKDQKEYSEYCGVAEYYLAGVLYQADKVNGDTQGMNLQKEKMLKAEQKMGSLKRAKKDIDKIVLFEE